MKYDTIRPIAWKDDMLALIDQRVLPQQHTWLTYNDAPGVADAIRDMVVRGAPAIGITAAFGVVLSVRQHVTQSPSGWRDAVAADCKLLAQSRPTAVNLFWALERMQRVLDACDGDPLATVLAQAQLIMDEDIAANHTMGKLGAGLIDAQCSVLTHCNAGALATGGYGTALGVIRAAFEAGKIERVFADETRPWMQGARLTAWEMVQEGIPVTLLGDAAAAHLMKTGQVQWVIVGSDRIAANGDVANKIGTYSAAIAARHHGVKFMVVAPTSTVDMQAASGDDIPIELRDAAEVLCLGGQKLAADGAEAWNPAFDVTPASLVDAIVTEKGVVLAPTSEKMVAMMAS